MLETLFILTKMPRWQLANIRKFQPTRFMIKRRLRSLVQKSWFSTYFRHLFRFRACFRTTNTLILSLLDGNYSSNYGFHAVNLPFNIQLNKFKNENSSYDVTLKQKTKSRHQECLFLMFIYGSYSVFLISLKVSSCFQFFEYRIATFYERQSCEVYW